MALGTAKMRVRGGFSLMELLVAMALFALMMGLLFQVTAGSSDVWRKASSRVGSFQAARAAFESLTRNLSQATLQTYFDYADAGGRPVPLVNPSFTLPGGSDLRNRTPQNYLRNSELHFLTAKAPQVMAEAGVGGVPTEGSALFFQAPLGFVGDARYNQLRSLLTVCGYYVEFGTHDDALPDFLAGASNAPVSPPRYRLMEVLQPAEDNAIYASTNETDASGFPVFSYDLDWIRNLRLDEGRVRHVLAENVILLLFLPKLSPEDEKKLGGPADGASLAPAYAYDSRLWEKELGSPLSSLARRSRNQLPPLVEVIMVVIDEPSAAKLERDHGQGGQPPLANASLRASLGLDRFTNAAELHGANGDLARLEQGLQDLGLTYRIFQTEVPIQGAKWSE